MHSNLEFSPPFSSNFDFPSKTPIYRTLLQEPVSGRGEIRAILQPYPLWKIDYKLTYARGGEQSPNSVYAYILGFFMNMGGQFSDFLYQDPNDNQVTNAFIGIGDGATLGFQLIRQIGNIGTDIVQNPNTLTPLTIYVNGTAQTLGTDYTIGYAGLISFVTAPANGAVITWSGSFYYRVRFNEDDITFDQFMAQLWSCDSVPLKSIIL